MSGNAKRISMLQAVFDTGIDDYGLHLNWDDYTVHDASNVMRRFLNYLPEPLISLHYQALFKTTLGTTLLTNLILTRILTQEQMLNFLVWNRKSMRSRTSLRDYPLRINISCCICWIFCIYSLNA